MAVDTENKRFSFMFGRVMPSPDGSFNAADRAQLLGLYSGIALGAAYTTVGGPFLYTAANWGTVAFYFEAFFRATAGTVRARLYNTTDSVAVANSEVTTANAVFNRQRSADISANLADGKEYRAQTSKGAGGTGDIHSAVLVVA